MKVLQVVKLYYPWLGGVEKVAQDIAEGLNGQNGTRVDVLCCQSRGRGLSEKVNGVDVYRSSSVGIFRGMPISIDFLLRFRKMANNYDVIDIHQPFPLADLALLIFRPKCRVIVHYHSDLWRQKFLKFIVNPLITNTLIKSESILVSNPNLIKYSNTLKNFRNKCKVVPFGVDIADLCRLIDAKKMRDFKVRYGDYILFVGRLSYYKGVNYLLDAIVKIENNLIIIGSGEMSNALKTQAEQLGVINKVHFLGSLAPKEKLNFMAAASLLVLPSIHRSEAFGIVLIEAMAYGIPVISTELQTGTSWVNLNNKTGLVVPPADSRALTYSIEKLMSSKALRLRQSLAAKQRVLENFQLSDFLSKTLAVYMKELNDC